MSYLRGPLTREQIQTLMALRKQATASTTARAAAASSSAAATSAVQTASAAPSAEAPALPSGVRQWYLPLQQAAKDGLVVYRAALLGQAKLHFVSSPAKVDLWTDRWLLAPAATEDASIWESSSIVKEADLELEEQPRAGAKFEAVPDSLRRAASYKSWSTALKDHLYASQTLTLWRCAALKQASAPDESEGDFRIRMSQQAKELRDAEVEDLRKKYATKVASLEGKIGSAEERASREKSQYQQSMLDTALSFGGSVLGALFGRKVASVKNLQKAASGVSRAGRTVKERSEAARAGEKVEDLRERLGELETELEGEIEKIKDAYQADALRLEEVSVRARKSDVKVESVAVLWVPWIAAADGTLRPGHELATT
jgi:hypothetical protein